MEPKFTKASNHEVISFDSTKKLTDKTKNGDNVPSF